MDIVNKAKDFLNSDQAEEKSDQILDQAAEFAKDKLGADKADQISKQYTGQNMTGRNGGSVHKPAERSGNGQNQAVKNKR